MKTHLECLPCFLKQALSAARFVTDDEARQAVILRQVLREAAQMDLNAPPPVMGYKIHKALREATGNPDPYREAKRRFNALALRLLPEVRKKVQAAADPWDAATRVAIAANVIDFAIRGRIQEESVYELIDQFLEMPLHGDPKLLHQAAENAQSILFLTDNAGEIVFDRLLLEQMPLDRVTVAVKGGPVINDATMEDAREAGLPELVRVIDNGADAPGTLLQFCSPEFREYFEGVDLIIAKGQANYESLSDTERPVFFLLKIKCPVVAADTGLSMGSLALLRTTATDTLLTSAVRGPATQPL